MRARTCVQSCSSTLVPLRAYFVPHRTSQAAGIELGMRECYQAPRSPLGTVQLIFMDNNNNSSRGLKISPQSLGNDACLRESTIMDAVVELVLVTSSFCDVVSSFDSVLIALFDMPINS